MSKELDRLYEELRMAEDAFSREFHSEVMTWRYSVGPVRLRAVATSKLITNVYILFNIICFVAGVIFIFIGGITASLGVALVVGALFSFGAFIAQLWNVAQQREYEVLNNIFGRSKTAHLRELGEKCIELEERIERLRPRA